MKESSPASGRLDWLAGVATSLSIGACYGTLLAVAALSLLGVSLSVNTTIWASAIVLFAGLAVGGVALGYRRHRGPGPLMLAAAGAGVIVWVMFGSYDRLLEVSGFAALVVAATWDWRKALCGTGVNGAMDAV